VTKEKIQKTILSVVAIVSFFIIGWFIGFQGSISLLTRLDTCDPKIMGVCDAALMTGFGLGMLIGPIIGILAAFFGYRFIRKFWQEKQAEK
jgi:hypothetical protein